MSHTHTQAAEGMGYCQSPFVPQSRIPFHCTVEFFVRKWFPFRETSHITEDWSHAHESQPRLVTHWQKPSKTYDIHAWNKFVLQSVKLQGMISCIIRMCKAAEHFVMGKWEKNITIYSAKCFHISFLSFVGLKKFFSSEICLQFSLQIHIVWLAVQTHVHNISMPTVNIQIHKCANSLPSLACKLTHAAWFSVWTHVPHSACDFNRVQGAWFLKNLTYKIPVM